MDHLLHPFFLNNNLHISNSYLFFLTKSNFLLTIFSLKVLFFHPALCVSSYQFFVNKYFSLKVLFFKPSSVCVSSYQFFVNKFFFAFVTPSSLSLSSLYGFFYQKKITKKSQEYKIQNKSQIFKWIYKLLLFFFVVVSPPTQYFL
jgi:hypothetical protein